MFILLTEAKLVSKHLMLAMSFAQKVMPTCLPTLLMRLEQQKTFAKKNKTQKKLKLHQQNKAQGKSCQKSTHTA